jgi:hypothetical protein
MQWLDEAGFAIFLLYLMMERDQHSETLFILT